MTYLSVEQLSKSYGLKPLFEHLTFGISRGDKTALVAPNGTGKSTLLRVLAGSETPDNGEVMVRNGIHLGFLEQEPVLDDRMTIREYIAGGESKILEVIREYEAATRAQAETYSASTHARFEKAMAAMHAADAWDYEQRMHQILSKLQITELDQPIASLSGGERKRVALGFVLLDNPDLLLLDEPTNHLDVTMIEWLEQYLATANTTLLMVTHDRYFLDRVCNHIIEIDHGKLYQHNGNYSYYLRKKAERLEVEQVATDKAGQLLKKEIEWMRRMPKARGTKSKSRIADFYDTAEKAKKRKEGPDLRLEVNMQRMGKKIVEVSGLKKRFGDTVILDGFSYSFSRGERIGIIGNNGTGKTTFLNVITQEEPADAGEIDTGSTIVYGHYRQKGIDLDENMRVIDVLKEIAEVIELADGRRISASQFLEHFMFSPKMQYTPVGKLSGGERRRLGLMMVLIKNPNFLILDEPTNDLDLDTLNRLEDFLMNFGGCLIIVSHDRFFMDKLVQHYFIFEGNGVIRDFNGTYREYREKLEMEQAGNSGETDGGKRQSPSASKGESRSDAADTANTASTDPKKRKLTYKERKEYQKLEQEIGELEAEKAELESALSTGDLEYDELQRMSLRYGELDGIIDAKTMRWMELEERSSN
ncbi:ABC-F family ATP-binding cassette domain-containing protein [Balneolales bacterium ANBcel1]|nr:ABC-F family ATP-binding cassette domain-containing protein [Balneolales bacterium ANBcel1]